ncbi:hypothetical protein BD310DRAFT_779297, partial [Dichomitus squalens]
LTQETDSKLVIQVVTTRLAKDEAEGYIGKKNVDITRAVVAALRSRKAPVSFKWVKGHSGHTRNEGADRLADLGVKKHAPDEVDLAIPADLRLTGAKLQALTQRLAYKAIMNRKEGKLVPRPKTTRNLDMIQAGIEDACQVQVTKQSIWKSLMNSKVITREARRFMWMSIHDAYMIGPNWLKDNMSEEQKSRATCGVCNELESMTHIL